MTSIMFLRVRVDIVFRAGYRIDQTEQFCCSCVSIADRAAIWYILNPGEKAGHCSQHAILTGICTLSFLRECGGAVCMRDCDLVLMKCGSFPICVVCQLQMEGRSSSSLGKPVVGFAMRRSFSFALSDLRFMRILKSSI